MARAFDPAVPEMMDRPQPVTPELRTDLDNLRKLNRHFGSYRLVSHFLARWLQPGRNYRILDLATGSADIPRVIVDWAQTRGIEVDIDAVDAHPSTLAIARESSSGYAAIHFLKADALSFDPGQTYDLVICSLALHHFSDADAIRLLARCRALSHAHVLVADLERSWLAIAGIFALTATFFREPMTRTDARMSIRRAFSFPEFSRLAREAGWKNFGHARFRWTRQALWLDEMA